MGKGKIVAVISIFIVSFVSVGLIPVFAPSHPEYVGVDPPRKQIANGVPPHEVICSEGLELIFKATNGFPACVKPSTATKLVERGWGTNTPLPWTPTKGLFESTVEEEPEPEPTPIESTVKEEPEPIPTELEGTVTTSSSTGVQ